MVTHYASAKSIRRFTGINTDDVPDSVLEEYLNDADNDVMEDISIARINEPMSGVIDGVNTEFWVQSHPIADTNFDKSISSVDITIYKWGDSGSIDTKSVCNISSINPFEGRVKLTIAPSNTFDVITATYRFYPTTSTVNWNMVERAASLIAGYYYIMAEYILIPEQYARGAIRFRHAKPYYTLLDEYYRIIDRILTKNYALKETEETELNRNLMENMP